MEIRNISERVARLEARIGHRTDGVLTYDPWNGETVEDALARAPSRRCYLVVPVMPRVEIWEKSAREQQAQLMVRYSKPPSRSGTSSTS